MMVGLSLSRCVKDIFVKKINIDNVLIIITRTRFDPNNNEQWGNIWDGYTQANLFSETVWEDFKDNENEFRQICKELHNSGKLFQPRLQNLPTRHYDYYWLETFIPEEELENEVVKNAWERYKILSGLTK